MKTVGLVLTILGFSAVSFGVQIGSYSVSFNRADGRHGPLGDSQGWTCRSYQSMHFVGADRVNQRGEAFEQRRSESGPSGDSLLFGAGTAMGFQAEMEAIGRGRAAYLEVTQRCEKEELTLQSYYDHDDDQWKIRQATNTASQQVIYRCGFPNLPSKNGQKMKVECTSGDPSENRGTYSWGGFPSWGGFTWSQIGPGPLYHLANIPVDAQVTLDGTQETYTKELCNGMGKNRVVVRLTQGIEGRMGENDFEYTVQIDGGSPFVIRKRDALLHDDILLCTDKKTVDVKINAIEKDMFFNDKYVADGNDTVSIPLQGRVNEADIHLKRKRLFKTTNHDIKVTVFQREQEPAPRTGPMFAELPAHEQ